MINGHFTKFSVHQYGNSSNILEDNREETAIECWHKAKENSSEGHDINSTGKLPFKDNFIEVVTGAIMNGSPKEIEMNQEYTFYVFKVVIGRAYVMNE